MTSCEVIPDLGEVVSDAERLLGPHDTGSHSGQQRRVGLAGILALSSVGVVAWLRGDVGGVTASASASLTLDSEAPKVCSALGASCLDSGCCVDGGAKGYHCYQKDANWAECMVDGNCTPGVHPGEKEGHWDASGTFQKAKWSCKAVGDKSLPACWAYDKKKSCPDSRCQWAKGKCQQQCGTLASMDACWAAGNCMWSGGKCEDGCWETSGKTDCEALSRCQWQEAGNLSSCGLACHVHGGEQDCPHKDKCTWDGYNCVNDLCSAPGEDCTQTKCCSVSRGGLGMVCREKMEYWATCMDDFNATALKDWSGKKLGVRAFQVGTPGKRPDDTKIAAGCAWAGQDCGETKLCCNEGFTCNKKDDTFNGCIQAVQVSTWSKEPVPLPSGWDGFKLGDWRGEWQVEATPQDKDMAGTSLYCIMAVVPDSPEMALLWTAQSNNASIFACNASSVYKAWPTGVSSWDTAEATVVNTAVFLKVMKDVQEDGLYLNYDWTVKVDADCVFLPWRLRDHMWALRPPPDMPIYFKNNNIKGLGNGNFLGAIEVFSKQAMMKFMDNADDCGKFLGTNSGEDGFFKGCMDAMGVGFSWDQSMFKPNFDPAICTNGMYAAYHPMKYPSHWQRCWDIATGKICQGMTYDCGGELDPPITAGGIR